MSDKETMNHFEASESDSSSRSCSQEISGTTSVKTPNTIFLKHFLYAISYTRVTFLTMVSLLLKPSSHHLQIQHVIYTKLNTEL